MTTCRNSTSLSSESLEWKYVGESGEEIPARNSHSLEIVETELKQKILILYGGASPEHGVLGETFFATLPDPDSIGEQQCMAIVCTLDMLVIRGTPPSPLSCISDARSDFLVIDNRSHRVFRDVAEVTRASQQQSQGTRPTRNAKQLHRGGT